MSVTELLSISLIACIRYFFAPEHVITAGSSSSLANRKPFLLPGPGECDSGNYAIVSMVPLLMDFTAGILLSFPPSLGP